MAPRLQLLRRAAVSIPSQQQYQPLAPFLYPFLAQQRSASILSSLSDTKGAYNKRIRRGRGPASGKGKTSGRGHKGQGQRSKVPAGFNGGQTPEWVVHGTRGFDNHFSVDMSPINLNRIQYWIDQGRLDPTQPITLKELAASRCIHGVKDGVKLLARGKDELTTPVNIVVSRASAEAIAAVEKLGGSVTTRYYTPFAIRKVLQGQMDPIHSLQSRIAAVPVAGDGDDTVEGSASVAEADVNTTGATATATAPADAVVLGRRHRFPYRLPDPTKRKDLEYYRDAAHRGYLSHLVEEGHGPSLFFRTPGSEGKNVKKAVNLAKKKSSQQKSDNRLW